MTMFLRAVWDAAYRADAMSVFTSAVWFVAASAAPSGEKTK